MEEWQQRVVDEKKELDDKMVRLNTFTELDRWRALPWDERCRLVRQYSIMQSYSEILGERIAAFKC